MFSPIVLLHAVRSAITAIAELLVKECHAITILVKHIVFIYIYMVALIGTLKEKTIFS